MSFINHQSIIDPKQPGIYTMALQYEPNEKINSVLVVPEKGLPFEISLSERKTTYYTTRYFHFYVDGQFIYSFSELLLKMGDRRDGKAADSFKYLCDHGQTPESVLFVKNLIAGSDDFVVGERVWKDFLLLDSELVPTANFKILTREALLSLGSRLVALSEGREKANYNDGEGFTSLTLKKFLPVRTGNLYLDKLQCIHPALAEVIGDCKVNSVYLNGLKEMDNRVATHIGKCKGRLFLNGLKTIERDVLKNLTANGVKYISLRGLKEEADVIKSYVQNKSCFLSLASDEVIETNVHNYTKEEIDNSLASDKKQFAALKKLLTTPDKTVIDAGLLMLSSFSDPYLFDKLMEDVSINITDSITEIVADKLFKGSKKDQPFLNYAITGVLFYAGNDAQLCEKMKRDVKQLRIDTIDLSYLHCFSGLNKLVLLDSLEKITSLNDLNELLPIQSIKLDGCIALEDIDHLANFPLNSFYFEQSKKIKSLRALKGKVDGDQVKLLAVRDFNELETLDGIEFYQSLEELDLNNCKKIIQLAALKNIPNLGKIESFSSNSYRKELCLYACESIDGLIGKNSVNIDVRIKNFGTVKEFDFPLVESLSISCSDIPDLDWLAGFPNLTKLSISSKRLSDLSGLRFATKIKNLVINDSSLINVNDLTCLKDLESVNFQSCDLLEEIDGLADLPKLSKYEIRYCKNLKSIRGLTANKTIQRNLESLWVDSCKSLESLGDLSGFQNLQSIYLGDSFNNSLMPDLATASKLVPIKISYSQVTIKYNGDMVENEIEFSRCDNLVIQGNGIRSIVLNEYRGKDLSGFKGITGLERIVIKDTKSMESLDGINEVKDLKLLELSNLEKLVSIEGLNGLTAIKTLRLLKLPALKISSAIGMLDSLEDLETLECKQLEVKPRPLGKMDTIETAKHLIKLKTFYKQSGIAEIEKKIVTKANGETGKATKQTVTKIKKLLLERDVTSIDTAITILSGLQDEAICDSLLDGIGYQNDGFVLNKIFKGNVPAQPFLTYALCGVLEVANSFVKWKSFNQQVTILKCVLPELNYLNQFVNLSKLELLGISKIRTNLHLTELVSLILRPGNLEVDFNKLVDCKKLELFDINPSELVIIGGLEPLGQLTALKEISLKYISAIDLASFQEMGNCKQLESIYFSTGYRVPFLPAKDLQGLESLAKLSSLSIKGFSIKNTHAIAGLKNLNHIYVNSDALKVFTPPTNALNLSNLILDGCAKLESIEDASFPEKLDVVDLNNSAIESFPILRGVKSIKALDLNNCKQLKQLDAMKDLVSVNENKKMEFIGCTSLENIDGFTHLPFKKVRFDFKFIPKKIAPNLYERLMMPKLESLVNIEQFPFLTSLVLMTREGSAPLNDLSPLLQKPELKTLYLGGCQNIKSLNGIERLKKLEKLDLTSMISLSDIKVLEEMTIELIYIKECLLKKADFPQHLQDHIDWQSVTRWTIDYD
jgi:hypothetical protein